MPDETQRFYSLNSVPIRGAGRMVVVEAADALTATVLCFFGVNFFVLGMVLLGRGRLKDAGPIFLVSGALDGIIALILLTLSLGGVLSGGLTSLVGGDLIVIAFLVLIFAVTWVAAGIVAISGYDAAPLGSLGIFFGITMIPFAVFLFSTDRLWLTVNAVSWVWAFFTLPLAFLFKKISPKVAGWTFLIQAWYTLWIPAAVILLGFILP